MKGAMFSKVYLSNGIRLILVPLPGSPAVTVLTLVSVGSKYETKEISGISHFLEHLCFKGTTRRPRAIDISRELDSIGAQYNAFTSHEYTGYYAKVAHRHFKTALDVVSDIYLHSTFPVAEMEKEKGVIIEEINMYRDLPQYHVHDLYQKLLYGDEPAGRNIAGSKESVMALTRDDVVSYQKGGYVGAATTVVIAGQFDESNVVSMVEEAFTAASLGEPLKKKPVIISQAKPGFVCEEKVSDQVHLVLGIRTFDVFDTRNASLKVLASVLGGGMSSRLYEKLRNDLGICYYVSADTDEYTDHGSFTISAGVDAKRLPEAISAILQELKTLRDKEVPPDEFKKAKDYLTGSLALSLETSNSLASYFGIQEVLHEKIKTPAHISQEIEEVTVADVQKVASDIIRDEGLNLALVGVIKDKESLVSLLTFS